MDTESMVSQYVAHGWDANSARADINAGGWKNKEWISGGGSYGGVNIPPFTFDTAAAEKAALAELTPYYTKILQMYGGDVALAKQRIDQDYERGLRVKTENTEWELAGNAAEKVERQRKFKIALGDIDQQMNARGIATSGISEAEKARAIANEAYQTGLIDRSNVALETGLKQYTEGANVDYQREAERLGYAKPTEMPVAGEFAPPTTGINSPGPSYNIANFASEPAQKEVALEEQKRQDIYTKVNDAWSKAQAKWMADASRLAQTAYST